MEKGTGMREERQKEGRSKENGDKEGDKGREQSVGECGMIRGRRKGGERGARRGKC